jgi:serine/threonine protein kinase
MPTLSIGKYQVLATLGKGAHSTILKVRRSADGAQYALKVVPIAGKDELKFLDQAEHEFQVAQKLNHPAIIKIFALERLRTWLFQVRELRLLIEYVNGKTLDTFPMLPIAKLVQIFAQVAAGLVHMHRRGVCHADLKPGNIMLSRTGDVKIIDFGLAWVKGDNKDRVQGTPEYMAPEQFKSRLVNEKTDLFNFGATMYRLVTWRHIPPVVAEGVTLNAKVFEQHLRPVSEANPKTPASLAELIHCCLAYNPHQRVESATEVQTVLNDLVEQLVQSDDDKLEALEWQE